MFFNDKLDRFCSNVLKWGCLKDDQKQPKLRWSREERLPFKSVALSCFFIMSLFPAFLDTYRKIGFNQRVSNLKKKHWNFWQPGGGGGGGDIWVLLWTFPLPSGIVPGHPKPHLTPGLLFSGLLEHPFLADWLIQNFYFWAFYIILYTYIQ